MSESSASTPVVWITGAGGLVGSALVRTAAQYARGWRARGLTRQELDISRPAEIRALFARERPSLIIHCAAISKSPACEANRSLAREINVEATRYLAETAGGIPFIFFSTDLIFDGRKGDYTEEDAPNPLMFYGETKVMAEEIVRQHPRHTIVRISLTGGHSPTGDRGFNEEMKNSWRAGKLLDLFVDEFRSPNSVEILSRAVWELVATGATGIYHLSGAEKLSRYEIGRLLADRHPELAPRLRAGSRAEYQGPPRPADTSLSIAKVQRFLSFPVPKFSEWLAQDRTGF